MFYPAVFNKAPLMYAVAQVMAQGTAVKLNAGLLVPATDGTGVLGFVAQEVIDWRNRPIEYTMAAQQFTGHMYDPVMINRPGVLARPNTPGATTPGLEYESGMNKTTNENAATNVGVWNEIGSLFITRIKTDAGADIAGLAVGTNLCVGLQGQLRPHAGAPDAARAIVAQVHAVHDGVGMPLPMNSTVPSYIVRLSGNLG